MRVLETEPSYEEVKTVTVERIHKMNTVVKAVATLVIGATTMVGAALTLNQIRKGEDPSGPGNGNGMRGGKNASRS